MDTLEVCADSPVTAGEGPRPEKGRASMSLSHPIMDGAGGS